MDRHVWPADPWRVFTQNWHKPRHAFPRWSADKQYLASPTPQIQFLHPTSILGHAAASTPLHRESMEMQGYCIVGTHSGFALKKQPGLVMPSWRWEKGGKASLLPGAELSLRSWSGNAKVRCPHCSRQLSRQQTCNQCLTRLRVFVLKCNP